MSHISGTFNNQKAGKLYVTLTGNFAGGGVTRDAGFNYSSSGSSTANLLVRVTVNGVPSSVIDRYSPIITMVLDYPGNNTEWSISTETVGYSFGSGLGSVSMTNLVVTLQLVMK
jgi:hypothetical protein